MKKQNQVRYAPLLLAAALTSATFAQAAGPTKGTTTKRIARAPQNAGGKPVIIPRNQLPTERNFEFQNRPSVIPDVPARFQAPAARGARPETSLKGLDLKPEAAVPQPKGAAAFQLPKGAMPTLGEETVLQLKATADQLKTVENYTADELRLFESYVLLEDQKKPLPALGSFATLMTKKSPLQDSARWGYAHAALALGLRVQYEVTLLEFLNKGTPAWSARATESLVRNSDMEKSVWVQHLSDGQFSSIKVEKTSDAYLMLRVHRQIAQKQVKDALETLKQIAPNSKIFGLRAYFESLLEYRQGHLDQAKDALQSSMKEHPDAFKENEIKAKANMLMGRLNFQSRDFNKAFDSYRSVPKNNPVWPEAMMEQALSQILFEDFEGAAGNMFSLHTDFFKKSYSPDSYLIRTVGYLNLCQYADALQVVQDLQRKYKPILDGLVKYQKANKSSADYDTIREFAKNPGVNEVRGVARPFLFAWTQDPDFQRHQVRINQFEDELEAFRGLSLTVVKQEREMSKKIADASDAVSAASAAKATPENIEKLKVSLENVKTESRMLQLARKSLAQIRPEITAKLEGLKEERKQLALQALSQKRDTLYAQLKGVIDQSEVLLYEIYNGAGDHLRFQAAGGEIEARKTAALVPKKDEAVNWKFKGEIWEDELGHFRSSLSNVCAKETASK